MIPRDLLSVFPHRQFHTLPGLLDSWAALPNSNPNACMPMQGGSLYHFYDGLWYDPASSILTDNVHATVIPQVPPWTMHHPKICLDLSVLAKKDTPSHVYIQKFNEIKDQYSYCTPIYADGSKDNDRVGCGLIINNLSIINNK